MTGEKRLKYLEDGRVVDAGVYHEDADWYHDHLMSLVMTAEDLIFFVVEYVPTTDLWRDVTINLEDLDIDYNTAAFMIEGGIYHTYDPKCPIGCCGQFEDCSYR